MPKEEKHTKKQQNVSDTGSLHPKILEAGEVRTLLSWEAPSRPFRKKKGPTIQH